VDDGDPTTSRNADQNITIFQNQNAWHAITQSQSSFVMCPDAPALNFDVSDMKDPLDLYGWLQKKRELSEKVLSDFIKFL
jgi:hypothetical protein